MAPKTKADVKAARSMAREEKESLQAAGVTKDLKKQMQGDALLCTVCVATQLGPGVCVCKGGGVKPPPGYDATAELLEAAKQRHAVKKEAEKLNMASKQGTVQASRAKNKEARDQGQISMADPGVVLQGDGTDCLTVVEFQMGKLGLSIEKNAVSSVGEAPSQALELGVKVGWVICEVNGEDVPAKKVNIMKKAAACMKEGPVKFTFRTPIADGFHHCAACDKFLEVGEFDGEELSGNGPGKQKCLGCAEFADMFG
ncbi:hypothetical protein CYMTET_43574 [Cymbomonas tetramitiformis]|uniref:PDZ domain-containing protein n=1 Tax=Cymbomonas tetramitiformis TaxID=36881 RepID=A0AAE0F0E9_9CHLO|nr:hypothetical protein CYMTET_43574 [Cymbomonas tetramitiformis]